jgi:hypothetical protein
LSAYFCSFYLLRVDMGTCDELALDVLVNTLLGFSRDFCGLKKVYLGGVNRSWPVPEEEEENEEDMVSPVLEEEEEENEEDMVSPVLEEEEKNKEDMVSVVRVD